MTAGSAANQLHKGKETMRDGLQPRPYTTASISVDGDAHPVLPSTSATEAALMAAPGKILRRW